MSLVIALYGFIGLGEAICVVFIPEKAIFLILLPKLNKFSANKKHKMMARGKIDAFSANQVIFGINVIKVFNDHFSIANNSKSMDFII